MTRLSAASRLRRLLALIPWVIAQRDGAPVDEVCRRFGLSRDALERELNLLWMVGVYPYTPHELIDWEIDGHDRLHIYLADWFKRPLRLTPDQALALVVTGRSLESVPGADPDGALARGVAKVASVLGVDPATVEVDLGEVEEATLELLRTAISERRQVELRYYTYGRDEHTRRVIDPWHLFASNGEWYVEAYCHHSGARRTFRVDRIDTARLLDEPIEQLPSDDVGPSFHAGPEAPRVVLELAPPARWVTDEYPVEEVVELGGGSVRVTLAVTARAWFERLLLRLGPAATVLDAPAELATAGADAAARVLARYSNG